MFFFYNLIRSSFLGTSNIWDSNNFLYLSGPLSIIIYCLVKLKCQSRKCFCVTKSRALVNSILDLAASVNNYFLRTPCYYNCCFNIFSVSYADLALFLYNCYFRIYVPLLLTILPSDMWYILSESVL